jgi:hypothetical protein
LDAAIPAKNGRVSEIFAWGFPGVRAENIMKRQEWDSKLKTLNYVGTFGPPQGLGDTMWQYRQFRAGKLYNTLVFNTRQEAEDFASEMTRIEPDLFCQIEPVEARAVWN